MRIQTGARPWLARLSILCLLQLAMPIHPAGANGDLLAWREARDMPQLIAHLEDWLDAHTDLPRRKTAPLVRLTTMAHAANLAPARTASNSTITRGLYDAVSQTIWLVRPWEPTNPYDASVLLHELVHHRQAEHGHWYCPGAQELPAYRLQQSWLNDLGLEPDVNWIAVILEAGCTPPDIHPD